MGVDRPKPPCLPHSGLPFAPEFEKVDADHQRGAGPEDVSYVMHNIRHVFYIPAEFEKWMLTTNAALVKLSGFADSGALGCGVHPRHGSPIVLWACRRANSDARWPVADSGCQAWLFGVLLVAHCTCWIALSIWSCCSARPLMTAIESWGASAVLDRLQKAARAGKRSRLVYLYNHLHT